MSDAIPAIVTIVLPAFAVAAGIRVNDAKLDELKAHMDARFQARR